jgi:hypothetical protein
MLHVFRAIGATRHKTYRIFEKQLI